MKLCKAMLVATGLLALVAAPVLATEPGTWTLRAGVGTVQPDSNNLTFVDEGDTVTIDVGNGTAMTLSGTYMFNENWAFDILASLPFSHDIKATVDVPDVGMETAKVGKTKQLPPTVSVQYHFAPQSDFQPYVGLGVNWTTFYDTELASEFEAEGIDKLCLDDSFGLAAQIGGDWQLNDNWVANLDIRYIDIETDATVDVFEDSDGSSVVSELKLGTIKVDPWVYSVNLGYQFR